MSTACAPILDVRTIAPRDRHPLIFGRFDALPAGESMQLVNDHDPRPLYYQFEQRYPEQFDWTYLQSGPDLWQVRITRSVVASDGAFAGSCCSGGACGG
ncbi:MAG: DUF2249 domain-containing protein [Rhodoferax sp.]|jgi:uncharacterized protein (DUF2249 family)|nr:DUF2249 domain-containing protein [Rhodoferax sp.]